jgi:hypothetical protein
MENVTRSYVKIIEDLNKVPLADLAWPAGSKPQPRVSSTAGQ